MGLNTRSIKRDVAGMTIPLNETKLLHTIESFTMIKSQDVDLGAKIIVRLNQTAIDIFTNLRNENRMQPLSKLSAFAEGGGPQSPKHRKNSDRSSVSNLDTKVTRLTRLSQARHSGFFELERKLTLIFQQIPQKVRDAFENS